MIRELWLSIKRLPVQFSQDRLYFRVAYTRDFEIFVRSSNHAEILPGCLSHLFHLCPSLSDFSGSVLISYGADKKFTGNQIITSQNKVWPIFRTGMRCWMRWCFRFWCWCYHHQWCTSILKFTWTVTYLSTSNFTLDWFNTTSTPFGGAMVVLSLPKC